MSMENRDLFPDPQIRLQGRGIAVGAGGAVRALPRPEHDRGLADHARDDAGPGMSRPALRRRV